MADELKKYRSATVGSEEVLYFFNVPTDIATWETKAYHMGLIMAEANTSESGVTTEDPPDVTSKVAGHAITGYKKTITHTGPYLKGEPVCEFERFLYDHDITDERTTVDVLRIYTWDTDDGGKMKAFRATAVCEVTQGPSGSAQAKAQISATYTYTSEEEEGTATFDKETGVATFTPKAAG